MFLIFYISGLKIVTFKMYFGFESLLGYWKFNLKDELTNRINDESELDCHIWTSYRQSYWHIERWEPTLSQRNPPLPFVYINRRVPNTAKLDKKQLHVIQYIIEHTRHVHIRIRFKYDTVRYFLFCFANKKRFSAIFVVYLGILMYFTFYIEKIQKDISLLFKMRVTYARFNSNRSKSFRKLNDRSFPSLFFSLLEQFISYFE